MSKGFGKDPWQEMPTSQLEFKKNLFAENGLLYPNCSRFFYNTHYHVTVFDRKTEWGTIEHLMISEKKGRKIDNHWQFLQKVKNEICGEERLAIEIYPPQSELIDEVNAYHLWVFPAGFKLPFGLQPGWLKPETLNVS